MSGIVEGEIVRGHTGGAEFRIVRSRRNKHSDSRFIMCGSVWFGKVYGHDGQPVERNASLVVHALQSYDRNCGKRAVECAESDLLGEALSILCDARSSIKRPGGSGEIARAQIVDRIDRLVERLS